MIGLQASDSTSFAVDWPLQFAVSGLLLSLACWTERPRGWADSDLVEVHAAEMICMLSPPSAFFHPD